MPLGYYDLYIDRNSDFNESWTYEDTEGTPIDLTDSSFQAQIKEKPQDDAALITITVTTPVPATGEIKLHISQADCEKLLPTAFPDGTPKYYVWDILKEAPDGETVVFLSGRVFVKDGVTSWA